MTSPAPWSALVVDEGDPARACGVLLRIGGEVGIAPDGARVLTDSGRITSMSPRIDVRAALPGPSARRADPFGRYEGCRVEVRGVWQDDVLAVGRSGGVRMVPARAVTVDVFENSRFPPPVRRPVPQPEPPGAAEVKRELRRAGLLIGLWRRGVGDPPRYLALATDPAAVADRLARVYGDAVLVVRGRWTRQTLDQIQTTLLADRRLLRSIGRQLGADGQLRETVTLTHLPARLADRLHRFPADAIDLRVLVEPDAGAGS